MYYSVEFTTEFTTDFTTEQVEACARARVAEQELALKEALKQVIEP